MKITPKEIIGANLPPNHPRTHRKPLAKNSANLFDGDDGLFKRILSETRVYGEYGCGASTAWALENTNVTVRAVDTSKQWVDHVLGNLTEDAKRRVSLSHIDLGEIENWGRPIAYSHKSSFPLYTDTIWLDGKKPDTVLIDGRFRVCCFLTSLKYADEGTRLIFDDYADRPHYHVVEQFVKRAESCGRQCLFLVPSKASINLAELDEEIEKFRYVMD